MAASIAAHYENRSENYLAFLIGSLSGDQDEGPYRALAAEVGAALGYRT